MKKTIILASVAVAAIFAFSSCQKEDLENTSVSGVRIITAEFENTATKTTLSTEDNVTPLWSENDKIRVFGTRTSGNQYDDITLTSDKITNGGRTITFPTELTGTLYAVYPASAAESCSDGKITFTIPAVQNGTFASANICVAKSSTTDETNKDKLVFSNATAVLEFDAGTTGVKSVRMRAANAIAGKITVSFGTDNKIDNTSYATTNLTSRTITAGSATYTDSKFYVAVAPVSTGAVGFKYYKDIDNVARFDDGIGAAMTRNKIYTLSLPTATTDYTKDYEKIGDLKWATQNAFVSISGKKTWKGGNTNNVKVPGTIYPVVVGDYFQWGAHAGYCGQNSDSDKGLLIYNSFNNTGCGDTDTDGFAFKSLEGGKSFWFYVYEYNSYKAVSPYLSEGSGVWKQSGDDYDAFGIYTKYDNNDSGILDYNTLQQDDDVAYIIYGDDWRMPTSNEFSALKAATYWAWDADDMGYYVFSPTSTHSADYIANAIPSDLDKADALLFFPAAGYADTGADQESASFPGGTPYLGDAGACGDYWSSSLYIAKATYTDEDEISHYNAAIGIDFGSAYCMEYHLNRYLGCSVRPVLQ